jgi:hypothetical protein
VENGQIIGIVHLIGVVLIAASIIVGITWAITKNSTLEPIAFILATAGGLLLALG